MIRVSLGAFLASLMLFASPTAMAVVVEIDISTQGEPVPGTSVTFETEDGEEIPPVELTELTEEPGTPSESETPSETETSTQTPQVSVPASSSTGTEEEEEDTTDSGQQIELPDSVVGTGVVVVVRKDNTLIKREPVTIGEDGSELEIEAYDPADAGLAIDVEQPKQCERGKPCDYQISMTNEGNGIYTGPLFLSGKLTGTVAEPESETEWRCGSAGGGKQFCFTYALLEPGASETWTVPAQLPGSISQSSENCLEITTLDGGPQGRSDPIVQAVQAGLAANGISTGKPDGIAGPATQAAMAQYIESTEMDPSADQSAVFEALFGLSPARLARLNLETPKDCEKIDLKPLPKTVKTEPKKSTTKKTTSKKSGTTSKTSSRKTTTSTQKQERRKRALGTAIGVGVGIGLGAATRGSSSSGKHHRY